MDQDEEKPKVNACLMDAIEAGVHAEWLEHPVTKMLIERLNDEVRTSKQYIIDTVKLSYTPDSSKLGYLGANLAVREAVLAYFTERSNG